MKEQEKEQFQDNQTEENQTQANDNQEQPEVNGTQDVEVQSETGAEAAGDNVETIDPEMKRLQALADDYQQRALRTQADFDNFRKRTQKEKEDFAKYASSKLITELLPVIDNFDRAFAAAGDNPEVESFAKGMNMIYRQLEGVLKAEGLEAMETVGQPFNPEFHQAIMQVESDEYEEGIVVEEVQKGYMLKDRVLRPAMVKVSM